MQGRKAIFLFLLTMIVSVAFAQTEAEESNLKAAFIYNFTRFIEWDDDIFPNEFVIGIVGTSLIDEPLEEISKTKMVNNKKIIIKYFNTIAEVEKCNILFVSRALKTPLSEFLDKPELKRTLIVSEKETYAQKGAGINFVIIDNKLKFEINTRSINDAGLKVSAQLLKLAIIVN